MTLAISSITTISTMQVMSLIPYALVVLLGVEVLCVNSMN